MDVYRHVQCTYTYKITYKIYTCIQTQMCTPLICIGISLTHVCMYVCMHVCTYVRMHVCISLSRSFSLYLSLSLSAACSSQKMAASGCRASDAHALRQSVFPIPLPQSPEAAPGDLAQIGGAGQASSLPASIGWVYGLNCRV